MNIATSLQKDEFLERVAEGLADLSEEDREEVLQDLRAHLAELEADEIRESLGTPESFVSEFRASAGLDQPRTRAGRRSIAHLRARVKDLERRLAETTNWAKVRPVWVWARGWLLVSSIAVFSGGTAFSRFPIPTIEGRTAVGLFLVIGATWLSLWLDRGSSSLSDGVSSAFSVVTAVLILASVVSAPDLSPPQQFAEEEFHPDELVEPFGNPIYNIYAYDADGNSVDVFLYDQEGRPILTMPSWVYDEAEHIVGSGPYNYGEGLVLFARDEFGRLITNLYPLETFDHSGQPTRPPSLGFPDVEERAASDEITTTTLASPLG